MNHRPPVFSPIVGSRMARLRRPDSLRPRSKAAIFKGTRHRPAFCGAACQCRSAPGSRRSRRPARTPSPEAGRSRCSAAARSAAAAAFQRVKPILGAANLNALRRHGLSQIWPRTAGKAAWGRKPAGGLPWAAPPPPRRLNPPTSRQRISQASPGAASSSSIGTVFFPPWPSSTSSPSKRPRLPSLSCSHTKVLSSVTSGANSTLLMSICE